MYKFKVDLVGTNMELVVAYIAKAVLLITSIVLYVYLFSKIIPTFIMKAGLKNKNVTTCDRGLKKFIYPDGRCVLYEPELAARRYVKSYALYTEGGYKYIRCKAADGVGNLWYDVYAFDNRNKLVDVVWVSEELGLARYTAAVALPPQTSYVRFVLRQADNDYFSNKILLGYSKVRYAICSVIVAVSTFIESMFMYVILRDFILNAFGLNIGILNPFIMFLVSIGIAAIITVFTILVYHINSKKVINK